MFYRCLGPSGGGPSHRKEKRKMKHTQISGTFGDETALYAVEYKATTVGEFVEEVLRECPDDWGEIRLDTCRCGYRRGKLETQLPPEALPLHILRVEGYGGWSRMDYTIKTIG